MVAKGVFVFVIIFAKLVSKGSLVFDGEIKVFDIEMCFQCESFILLFKV